MRKRAAALVVDDRVDQRALIRVLLRPLALDTVDVASAAEAATTLEGRDFDVAIVDLDLGDHFSFALLADLDRRAIPTVVITAHGFGSAYARVTERRPTRVVTKPFHPDLLRTAVMNALRT